MQMTPTSAHNEVLVDEAHHRSRNSSSVFEKFIMFPMQTFLWSISIDSRRRCGNVSCVYIYLALQG